VLMNWIETPMYVRQDLADSNHTSITGANGLPLHDCWQTGWNPDPFGCDGTTFAHAGQVLAQVDDLALLRTQARTHTVLGTTLARPSGFFPACGYHDGAHTDEGFYSRLNPSGGGRISYANALWLWFQFPNVPLRYVEGTTPMGNPTGCPPPPP
jgi:hypothetical protein